TLAATGLAAQFSAVETGASGYFWDFGDGETASGATVTHAYRSAGSYPVTLTFRDRDGVLHTSTQTIRAQETAVGRDASRDAPAVAGKASGSALPAMAWAGFGLLTLGVVAGGITLLVRGRRAPAT
ncbi:MAG: PKD domain-containing protein, partial [Halobacteriales archaeon]|nr:PKD domain-containing protein [Halobacteriales archaeon]